MNNYSLLSILIQYHALQDNLELAKYLLDNSDSLNIANNSFQLGLDMLIRLNKPEEVFLALIKKNMIKEALIFLRKYRVTIDSLNPETITLLRKVCKENKNILIDFMY
jgi:hypothetical protein